MIVRSSFESKAAGSRICTIVDFGDLEKLRIQLEKCRCHIIVKIDGKNTKLINFMLKAGFSYSGATLSMECQIDAMPNRNETHIRAITARDKKRLFKICDESFSMHNRYANDAHLKRFAKQIHRQWIINSMNGYADYCCGYVSGAVIAGFGTLHVHKDCASIGLLAVGGQYRKQRIASRIIDLLKRKTLDEKKNRITAATEFDNYPALNLYAKKGFLFCGSTISLYRMAGRP